MLLLMNLLRLRTYLLFHGPKRVIDSRERQLRNKLFLVYKIKWKDRVKKDNLGDTIGSLTSFRSKCLRRGSKLCT